MEQDSCTTDKTEQKRQPRMTRFAGCLKHLHAASVIRSCTATALMVVGALAPFTLVHGFAAPPQDRPSRAVIAEIANLSQNDIELASGFASQPREEERTRTSKTLAKKLLAQAAAVESSVTQDMKRYESETAKLMGLDYRFKGEESLARKIESDAEAQAVSVEQAADGVHDVLRYTLAVDPDRYQETVPQVLAGLTEAGYQVQKFNNAWGGRYYQGVNVQLVSPDGVPVELQFHTPQSFAIKQASHGVYEIRRDKSATAEQKDRAKRLSLAYNAQVQMPEGADALAWPAA